MSVPGRNGSSANKLSAQLTTCPLRIYKAARPGQLRDRCWWHSEGLTLRESSQSWSLLRASENSAPASTAYSILRFEYAKLGICRLCCDPTEATIHCCSHRIHNFQPTSKRDRHSVRANPPGKPNMLCWVFRSVAMRCAVICCVVLCCVCCVCVCVCVCLCLVLLMCVLLAIPCSYIFSVQNLVALSRFMCAICTEPVLEMNWTTPREFSSQIPLVWGFQAVSPMFNKNPGFKSKSKALPTRGYLILGDLGYVQNQMFPSSLMPEGNKHESLRSDL